MSVFRISVINDKRNIPILLRLCKISPNTFEQPQLTNRAAIMNMMKL